MTTPRMVRGRDITASSEGIKAAEVPLEIQQEQLQLSRKQQLIDAMLAQNNQYRGNTEMAGNMAIKRSPWEAVAQTLGAGLLTHKQNRLDKEAAGLPEKAAEIDRSEMERVRNIAQGSQLPPDQQGPSAPGDPGAAQDAGLSSRSRVVQAFMQQKMKEEAEMRKQMAEGLTAQEQVRYLKDGPASLEYAKGQANIQAVPAGSTMLGQDGNPIAPLGPEAQRTQFTDAKGDVYERNPVDGSVRKLDNVAKNSISINTADDKGAVKAFELTVPIIQKSAQDAKDSIAAQRNINAMAQNDRGGIISGTMAEERTSLARAFGTMGMAIPEDKLANTEAFKMAATQAWQDGVKKYGGNRGMTQLEAAELKNLGPQGWMSPRGRQLMYKAATTYHQQVQDNFRNDAQSYSEMYKSPEMQRFFPAIMQSVFGPQGKNVGFDDGSSQPAPQQAPMAGAIPPLVPGKVAGAGGAGEPIPFGQFIQGQGRR